LRSIAIAIAARFFATNSAARACIASGSVRVARSRDGASTGLGLRLALGFAVAFAMPAR
jgi:hypothetical protein